MNPGASCFDVEPMWGSHAAALESALRALSPGSLVIEHGAGVYSSPLIAKYAAELDLRVVCCELFGGWSSWVRWLYGDRGRTIERAKQLLGELPNAALVFIDGAQRERGDLLKWSLERRVPIVIAHDTEDSVRKSYNYASWLFDAQGYEVNHDGWNPRTTTWRLR